MFTSTSKKRVETCCSEIQLFARDMEKALPNLQVSCGTRTKEEQEKAFKSGASPLHFPLSKHNSTPSEAIDFSLIVKGIAVWTESEFSKIGTVGLAIIKEKGYKIKWGGNFTKRKDKPHWETF